MQPWSFHLTAPDLISGITKVSEDKSQGHWRTLRPASMGKDQAGNVVAGKTWVRKSRLKTWFKPYKHQKEFIDEALSLPQSRD